MADRRIVTFSLAGIAGACRHGFDDECAHKTLQAIIANPLGWFVAA